MAVILVMLGLEVLGYVIFSGRKQEGLKFDGFSIFITLLIIMFCLGAYGVTHILQEVFGRDGIHIFSSISKYESVFNKELSVNPHGKDRLVINNAYGDVNIGKGDTGDIQIEAQVRIHNDDEEYVKEILDSLIEVSETNSINIKSIREQYLADKSKIQDINIDYYIKVPAGINIAIENRYGSVSVEDAPLSVMIENSYGDISVKSVARNLSINNSYAGIDIDGVGGNVIVNNRNGSVSSKNIMGNLEIENSYSDVSARGVNGYAKIANSNGRVSAREIDGNLTVDSRYCGIDICDINGNLSVKGSNGNMVIYNVGGDADIINKYGNIDVINAHKSININNNNGTVYFDTNEVVEKSLIIENEYDSIFVNLPKGQSGQFRAYVGHGKIYNNFDLDIISGRNVESLQQKVGDGDAIISASTDKGDIRILGK